VAIALGVAALTAGGVLTGLVIQSGHVNEWLAALQTLSSLVLIAITGVYVFLTYRMLQVQQRPIEALRLERELLAVQDLSEQLLQFGLVIDGLSKPYPLAIGSRPDPDELVTSAEEEEVLHDLLRLSYRLPPEIGALASRYTIEAGILMLLSSRIAVAVTREDIRSAKEHRSWRWDAFVETMSGVDPKWWTADQLSKTLAGRNMPESARSTLDELGLLVRNYFQPRYEVRPPSRSVKAK
jgi:hypothetical protein